jgi:type IV secretory pathway VirB3-like protein
LNVTLSLRCLIAAGETPRLLAVSLIVKRILSRVVSNSLAVRFLVCMWVIITIVITKSNKMYNNCYLISSRHKKARVKQASWV